jgi:hypothetical protein
MKTAHRTSLGLVAASAAVVWAIGASPATAQGQSSLGTFADKDGIFIDGRNFQIVPGKSKGDFAKRVERMGAREIGPGAIIFRSGDKLYIVGAPANTPALERQKGPIFVDYEPPKDPAHQKTYEWVKERHGLEMFKELLSPFRLPVDMTVKTLGCDGVSNAYFWRDGDKREIRICYEYLQDVVDRLPAVTTSAGLTPHDAFIGQLFFALMHETGHAMFDIFDAPIWGHQENAADQFSTYILLHFGGGQAHRLVKGAAYAYHGFIQQLKDHPEVERPMAAFSSDHGQPEERFYNLVCTAYGFDPDKFAEAVSGDWLPAGRAKTCKWEYEDAKHAFERTMGAHYDREQARKVLDIQWLTSDSAQAPAQ